ncbi:hypothetical protein TWF696_003223 [Orbilia brochopaga]|uniref:Uncharacterized protein n=1 Tax=Orbilia brochopaga TaxID=3140254 RepID=A0AAV9TY63_9PEZI
MEGRNALLLERRIIRRGMPANRNSWVREGKDDAKNPQGRLPTYCFLSLENAATGLCSGKGQGQTGGDKCGQRGFLILELARSRFEPGGRAECVAAVVRRDLEFGPVDLARMTRLLPMVPAL